jgi:hypothetical protein
MKLNTNVISDLCQLENEKVSKIMAQSFRIIIINVGWTIITAGYLPPFATSPAGRLQPPEAGMHLYNAIFDAFISTLAVRPAN